MASPASAEPVPSGGPVQTRAGVAEVFEDAEDKPYNIEWPFDACASCQTNPWNTPYDYWNRDQQMAFLRFIFPTIYCNNCKNTI